MNTVFYSNKNIKILKILKQTKICLTMSTKMFLKQLYISSHIIPEQPCLFMTWYWSKSLNSKRKINNSIVEYEYELWWFDGADGDFFNCQHLQCGTSMTRSSSSSSPAASPLVRRKIKQINFIHGTQIKQKQI